MGGEGGGAISDEEGYKKLAMVAGEGKNDVNKSSFIYTDHAYIGTEDAMCLPDTDNVEFNHLTLYLLILPSGLI